MSPCERHGTEREGITSLLLGKARRRPDLARDEDLSETGGEGASLTRLCSSLLRSIRLFPSEERNSLGDQVHRPLKIVCLGLGSIGQISSPENACPWSSDKCIENEACNKWQVVIPRVEVRSGLPEDGQDNRYSCRRAD